MVASREQLCKQFAWNQDVLSVHCLLSCRVAREQQDSGICYVAQLKAFDHIIANSWTQKVYSFKLMAGFDDMF
jgi:hypothetical protein